MSDEVGFGFLKLRPFDGCALGNFPINALAPAPKGAANGSKASKNYDEKHNHGAREDTPTEWFGWSSLKSRSAQGVAQCVLEGVCKPAAFRWRQKCPKDQGFAF